jgi:putative ABC transport system substrate-binding protein
MRKNSEIIAQHLAPWWAAAMKNLIYLLLIIALMVASSAAQAQQPGKIFRIGFLDISSSNSVNRLEAFRQELSKLGWIEGKNITIEYRFAEQKPERLPELAAELVRQKVDLIVVSGGPAALAAKGAILRSPS